MTPGRRRALVALVSVTFDGWPASAREVMAAAGFSSPSTAYYHLRSLERAGLAEQHPRRPVGGWLPTRRGMEACGL